MRLISAWLGISLAVLLLSAQYVAALTSARKAERKAQVQEMFKHGYNGYMKYAYPADELKSVSCKPSYRDSDPANHGLNDIHPNASLTLLDILSSLPLIHPAAYPDALQTVCTAISFDQDVKVQVFEMTIRALGSLLSTYQYLDRLPDHPKEQARAIPGIGKKKVDVKRYKGRVLELALDLGNRLMPAFQTATGLPYARVNLRYGVEEGETTDTCAAGAGSLILEFAVLSRLTGESRFEEAAHKAYMAIWNKRSEHDLIGNGIGVHHGQWLQPGFSGVGAGIDSFFEYGMKAAILLGDDEYLDVFQDSYSAVQTHIRTSDGFIYRPVQYRMLHQGAGSTIDSLAAFFPGLQVLAGDIDSAIKGHLVYWNLWRKHSALPESWVWGEKRIEWAGYPGRPEFVESNYYLYRATKDNFYLRVGERILKDLNERLRTKCGFATLRNVETGEKEDRMESFVLSETLKYLYLLFDESDEVKPLSNAVFTTEGHSLSLPHGLQVGPRAIRRALRRGEYQQCPAYVPAKINGLVVGIEQRNDFDYARKLIYDDSLESGVAVDERKFWSEHGTCVVPQLPIHAFDVVLGPLDQDQADVPPEDPSPSIDKVYQDQDGHWVITDVKGLKLGVRWRLDAKGYDIVKIGPHRVRTGQEIIVVDPSMEGYLPIPQTPMKGGPSEIILRFSNKSSGQVFLHAVGATATFGLPLSRHPSHPFTIGSSGNGITLLQPPGPASDGCSPFELPTFTSTSTSDKAVVMLDRGGCTFFQKALHATRAGAVGVLVAGLNPSQGGTNSNLQDPEGLIRPSAEGEPSGLLAEVDSITVVYVDWRGGDVLRQLFSDSTEIMVEVLALDGQTDQPSEADIGKVSASTAGKSPRQGRVGVGDHVIVNLRIVDGTP